MAKQLVIDRKAAPLVHVDEDLAQGPVLVLAGAQVHLVIANAGLLGVPGPAVGSRRRRAMYR
jgi:hypothetical protein